MKIKQINIVKVENGYVVACGEKNYIALEESKIKDNILKLLPSIIEELNKTEEKAPELPQVVEPPKVVESPAVVKNEKAA